MWERLCGTQADHSFVESFENKVFVPFSVSFVSFDNPRHLGHTLSAIYRIPALCIYLLPRASAWQLLLPSLNRHLLKERRCELDLKIPAACFRIRWPSRAFNLRNRSVVWSTY
jgi:hypothetical protein